MVNIVKFLTVKIQKKISKLDQIDDEEIRINIQELKTCLTNYSENSLKPDRKCVTLCKRELSLNSMPNFDNIIYLVSYMIDFKYNIFDKTEGIFNSFQNNQLEIS